MDSDELIGVPVQAAARIGHTTQQRLDAWRGAGLVVPAVTRRLGARKVVRLYDFGQLVEIRVVRELEERGAHIRVIKALLDAVRSPDVPRPLRTLRWAIDGQEPFVQLDGTWFGGRHPRQGVIPETLDLDEIRTDIRRMLRERVGEPGQVERRRGNLGSQDLFAGTRIPVEAVVAFLRAEAPDEEILEAYPDLTSDDIEVARAYA